MKDIISLMRPLQWSKNLFLFLPLFFAQEFSNISLLLLCVAAFVAMSLVSSSIYILNDICDAPYDRLHPSKSQRPIAARRVSIPVAIASCILLLLLSAIIVALYIPSLQVVAVLLTYLLLNIAYVFKLKHIAIVDVFVVALGFVLRILLGAAAVDVQASHWIIIMTFLLALFLVLAKRRDDVRKFEQTQTLMRSNISAYNCTFLDHSITLVSAVMLVSYIMYTVDAGNIARFDCNYIYATTIFVLAGLLRYLQITYVKEESWSPTRVIFHDPFLQSCVIGWLLLFAYIIYG